jgi:LysR family transcriptional regulator, nitrogen assimilation regulatory protein
MEHKKILALMAIARFESFSKAAEQLSVSQSLLSKQVTELESELGLRLLHRTGRGALLTPEGERLVQHGRRFEAMLQDAEEDVRALRDVPSGKVAIGISAAVGTTLTVPVLVEVRQTHPAIHLQLIEGISADVQEWLNTGRLDLAVAFDRTGSSALGSDEFLVEEELLLVSPVPMAQSTVEVAGASLQQLSFILTRPYSKLRNVIEAYTLGLGFELQPTAEVDSVPAMLGAVEAGLGHTILPFGAIRSALREGLVAAARLEPRLTRSLYLSQSTERVPTRAAKAVAAIVRRQTAALDAAHAWRPSARMLDRGKG